MQNVVPAQPCVGKLGIDNFRGLLKIICINFLDSRFKTCFVLFLIIIWLNSSNLMSIMYIVLHDSDFLFDNSQDFNQTTHARPQHPIVIHNISLYFNCISSNMKVRYIMPFSAWKPWNFQYVFNTLWDINTVFISWIMFTYTKQINFLWIGITTLVFHEQLIMHYTVIFWKLVSTLQSMPWNF